MKGIGGCEYVTLVIRYFCEWGGYLFIYSAIYLLILVYNAHFLV